MFSNLMRTQQEVRQGFQSYTTGSVYSRDGTLIAYRQLGRGSGVVLIQGAMGSAHNFMELASLLAKDFTVYVPDRRGRGQSGPHGSDYSLQKEMDDLQALVTVTGAQLVFGLSSGAIIALQASLTLPAVKKVAIFEPPLLLNGISTELVEQFEAEIAIGNVAGALVTGMQLSEMGPKLLNFVPRFLLELLVNVGLAFEGTPREDVENRYLTMRELAPTLHCDFAIIREKSPLVESFKDINMNVLLLGGGMSPAYFKEALDALELVVPKTSRIEFPALSHGAAWNRDRGGQPEIVASALQAFFST
jgi:pimeloyl-ACP methyl ester carboxylesterase